MVQLEPSGTATLPMRRVSAHSEKSTKDLGSLPVGHSTAMMRTRSVRVVRATLRLAGGVAVVVVRSRGVRGERGRRGAWVGWATPPGGPRWGWGGGDHELAAAVAAALVVLLQDDLGLAAGAPDARHG